MLGDYLLAAGKRPFQIAEHDCCTFPADWARLLTGVDPMTSWRGRYSTEDEAEAIISAAGGLVNLWAQAFHDKPEVAPADLQAGDIGVITVIGADGLVANGGIFSGRRWVFLAPRGLFASSIDPVHVQRAWRVA